jgi:hypothetical protein
MQNEGKGASPRAPSGQSTKPGTESQSANPFAQVLTPPSSNFPCNCNQLARALMSIKQVWLQGVELLQLSIGERSDICIWALLVSAATLTASSVLQTVNQSPKTGAPGSPGTEASKTGTLGSPGTEAAKTGAQGSPGTESTKLSSQGSPGGQQPVTKSAVRFCVCTDAVLAFIASHAMYGCPTGCY